MFPPPVLVCGVESKKSADLCFPKMAVSEPHHAEDVTFKRVSGVEVA